MNKEEKNSQTAISFLPKSRRKFFVAQYQLIPNTGYFVGLCCKVCSTWIEYGHDTDCPVPKQSKKTLAKYKKFMKSLEKLRYNVRQC